MSPITIGVLAISMSADAFIAALGRGAAREAQFAQALKIGLLFGLIETLTPLIGWSLGAFASHYADAFDHWIAFGLLGGVGLRMILQAFGRKGEAAPIKVSIWALVATACGTSIDAMAVGVSLAFLDVNILVIAASIGLATMCMSTAGILAGRLIGKGLGRWAEAVGGLALVGLGAMILVEHLGG